MPIDERHASTVGELVSSAREIARNWTVSPSEPQEIWYRGQPRRGHKLLPGLFRAETVACGYEEDSLFETFKAYGASFTAREPKSDWEWYFLSQHHGMPTRLLDWTENLLAAAYFAVKEAMHAQTRRSRGSSEPRLDPIFDDDSPVVWLLEAGRLNRDSVDEDIVITVGERFTDQYRPSSILNKHDKNRYPIAVLAERSNPRIVAQQGCFTIHGHESTAIDDLYATSPKFSTLLLGRIVLDRANLIVFCDELEITGMNELALFPDLDSVARHVKWIYRP